MENWPAAETDLGYFTTDHLDNVQILVCSAVIQGTVFNAQECIVVSGSIIVCQCAFFLYAVHFYWESICNMILEVILYLLFFSFSTNQILTLLSLGSVLILWIYPGSLRSVKWPFIFSLNLLLISSDTSLFFFLYTKTYRYAWKKIVSGKLNISLFIS